MGRKRKSDVAQESTTGVLRPEAKPELAKASTDEGDFGYNYKGVKTTNPSEMVAEKVKGNYWVMFIGADLFNPKLHNLTSTKTFNKSRRVPEDCFNDYLHFLTTGSDVYYRLADKKAILA